MEMKLFDLKAALVLLFALYAASAEARGYTIAENGNCVTVEFHYDEQGNFIGTSTQTGTCTIPNGVYYFRFAVKRNITEPTPVDPATGRPLSTGSPFYKAARRSTETLRDIVGSSADRRKFRSVRLPREFALPIEAALKNATVWQVWVPAGYFPPTFEREIVSIESQR